jgi:hypothetical protein
MSRLAMITFLSGPDAVDPGYGQGAPSPGYPTTGPIYGGGHPGNALPGGGHITTLPVFPFDPTLSPDNELPGDSGNVPSNELPRPGKRYVVKWLACQGLILVPDNSLPETAEPK